MGQTVKIFRFPHSKGVGRCNSGRETLLLVPDDVVSVCGSGSPQGVLPQEIAGGVVPALNAP